MENINYTFNEDGIPCCPHDGSVLNFVSMAFYLIPEVGCGQSPRSVENIENFADF